MASALKGEADHINDDIRVQVTHALAKGACPILGGTVCCHLPD
jgi:hypothetical protein